MGKKKVKKIVICEVHNASVNDIIDMLSYSLRHHDFEYVKMQLIDKIESMRTFNYKEKGLPS